MLSLVMSQVGFILLGTWCQRLLTRWLIKKHANFIWSLGSLKWRLAPDPVSGRKKNGKSAQDSKHDALENIRRRRPSLQKYYWLSRGISIAVGMEAHTPSRTDCSARPTALDRSGGGTICFIHWTCRMLWVIDSSLSSPSAAASSCACRSFLFCLLHA